MRLLAEDAYSFLTPSMLHMISGGGFPPDDWQTISKLLPSKKDPLRAPPDAALKTGFDGALKTVTTALLNAGWPTWSLLATVHVYSPLFFSKVTL